jgi:Holliday junction resolvase
LKSEGWWVMKIHGSAYQKAGVPDILAIKDGTIFFIEVKAPRGVVSKLQEQIMGELAEAGAHCMVARSLNDVTAWIGRYL